ncbi:c-type cytochrome [Pararoseomonas indoligenes]|uniref:Cytochrome c n=1 Tax=Roseomonas indoligenes TaxID=2820811 RepID=A0A940N050_9PROT|nr:cytochrome c [Pararoseomonas indoligenes]MBP0491887.1 cytochrome c [Pararoseomonas indoligenes]
MRAPSLKAGLLAAATGLAALTLGPAPEAAPDNFDAVERGRYLVILGDCVACHMNPNGNHDGSQGFVGGRPIETPFGLIATPNITPDRGTGIGTWSADEFYRAMHEGIRPGGARLYPAFPYTYFTKMTRGDVDSIYAYLNTLEPVHNPVDRNTLPFPFNIRASMLAWNAMFFEPGEFRPDPNRSPEWNRGAYIVEGPAHCGACHTPKNMLGGDRNSEHFAGGPLQGWFAASITNDQRLGLGSWSIDEIVEYLKTGRNARSAASGPMAEVVEYSTGLMTDADLRAIAVYLKEPPQPAPASPARTPVAATDDRMKIGEAIYTDRCMACHTGGGQGVPNMFPRLAGSQVVQQEGSETVLRVVMQGVRAAYTPHAPTSPAMPAFAWRLNDDQVAAVTTYIRNAWGNAAPAVSPGDAAHMRRLLEDRP